MEKAMQPQDYVRMFYDQKSGGNITVGGLCGRIQKGKCPSDVEYMSDGWKRLAWVMGSDGLTAIFQKPSHEVFDLTGFESDWVRAKLDQGNTFRLVVFPSLASTEATWTGLFGLIEKFYPEVLHSLLKYKEQLLTLSFLEIQNQYSH